MSFKEWFFQELCNDGIFDEFDNSEDDVTVDNIMETTDLDELDIETYKSQYVEYCKNRALEPIYDVE